MSDYRGFVITQEFKGQCIDQWGAQPNNQCFWNSVYFCILSILVSQRKEMKIIMNKNIYFLNVNQLFLFCSWCLEHFPFYILYVEKNYIISKVQVYRFSVKSIRKGRAVVLFVCLFVTISSCERWLIILYHICTYGKEPNV